MVNITVGPNLWELGTRKNYSDYLNYSSIVNGQSVYGGTYGLTNQNGNAPVVTNGNYMPSTNPQTKLDNQQTTNSSVLQFPAERPRYYMSMSINKYSRQNWRSVGTLNSDGPRIVLPLPAQMIDNQNTRYEVEPIGIIGDAGMRATSAVIDAYRASGGDPGAMGQHIYNSAKNGSLGTTEDAKNALLGGLSKLSGNFGQGIAAQAGISVNEFMTVMVKGPSYKQREFVWKFSPQTADESKTLREIIKVTNNAMALSLGDGVGSMFFQWPHIWKCEFKYEDESRDLGLQTFKMKPAILHNVTWNYTPNGIPSFYAGTSAPESVEARFSFIELEYWLAGQYE